MIRYLDSREATVDRFLAMIKQLEVDRDRLQLEVQRLTDELYLAHEALKREFVRHGIKEVTE